MFSTESLIRQHISFNDDDVVFVEADISKFVDKFVTNSFTILVEATNDDIVKSCFAFNEMSVHYITLRTDSAIAVIYQQTEISR